MANIEVSLYKGENNWALMIDPDGFVTEGTGSNFFMVKNNVLYTPEGRNVLRGITMQTVIDDLELGDSISVNGVCLTVIDRKKDRFSMDLVEETLNTSNLGELKKGDYVNLERAMKYNQRVSGHLVQ